MAELRAVVADFDADGRNEPNDLYSLFPDSMMDLTCRNHTTSFNRST
jgi:hypothetical protein